MNRTLAKKLIDVCEKRKKADLLIRNCRIVDVFSKTVFEGSISVIDGRRMR